MRTICAALLCATVAGCGVSTPNITVPTVPAGAFGGAGSGDSATFVVDAQTISVRQSGTASISNSGAPQLDHSGPLGCAGRYFTAHLTEHIRIFFRYTARDAYMLIGTAASSTTSPPARSATTAHCCGTAPSRTGTSRWW